MKHFVDVASFEVKAGDGGDGIVSFRREKYVPKGGPDGGNGGDGGHVYAVAKAALSTLYDFTHRHKFEADPGAPGQGALKTGKDGQDITLTVPVGTVIYEHQNPDTDEAKLVKIADLHHDGQRVRLAKAGVGGKGNATFKSSRNQAPKEATPGTPGEHKVIVLELKVVADVGLIGLPNAGKSTLLARLTNAKPEIAPYPFTTLSPNLGILEYRDQRIVLADIPGLIEGAAQGKGLGDDFLRHVERTRILVHLVDPLYQDPIEAYKVIRKELAEYSHNLTEKEEIVAITKLDVTEVHESFESISKRFKDELGIEDVLGISAPTGEGIAALQNRIHTTLMKIQPLHEVDPAAVNTEDGQAHESEDIPVFTIEDVKHFNEGK